ncbi:MAG: S9 family peptidase [Thermoleophilia bacterium]|nr:S9 family peptidase [Thermoleophilia bacterium]
MVPEDVYELTAVADPRVSPDARHAAVVVTRIDRDEKEYRSAIWLVPLDGSGPPRQFTSGAKSDGEPRWSPDGSELAFVSNRDGERRQLYVLPLGAGEARRLTNLKEDVTDVSWSPDGRRLVFAARVPDEAYEEEDERKRRPRRITRMYYKLDDVGWTADRRIQIYTVAAAGSGVPLQLTQGDYEASQPTWSPDGGRIAFVSARRDDWDIRPANELYAVATSGGEPERLTADDESFFSSPAWSPDGRSLACLWSPGGWNQPHHSHVAVVDLETGEHRVLTASLDRNCGPYPPVRGPVWDGDSILFEVEDGGNTHLYRVRADGGAEPELVVGGVLGVTGYDAAGGRLVHTASTPTTLSDLYEGDRRLTEVGVPFSEGRELVEPERFVATSPDGSEVEAWIVRPGGFEPGRRYPVILDIHGGPFTQYANKLFDEFQIYAGAGYAVVYSNPRGSSGYSEAWGRAINGPPNGGSGWGSVDYEDLMAVVDEALRRFDFCDPDRLAVTGGSYGGYMTSWIVSHTDRFRVACSERAVNNLYSEFGSSDFGAFFKMTWGAFAFEDPDLYLKHSPTTYADRITTPLLIVHSENDLRCNVEQGEWLFSILRLLRRDVEFVRFPAESHELSRSGSPVHRVMRFETILDWFGRHLNG